MGFVWPLRDRWELVEEAQSIQKANTNVFDLVMGHSLDMGHLAITVSHILK